MATKNSKASAGPAVFKVLSPLNHDNVSYGIDDGIADGVLSPDQVDQLVATKIIEPIAPKAAE